ncbi:hypothetical protein CNMCM6805_004360 [Aspergillus fumigatiaffinis]|uniref:Uncharacterized protein n=1 Tax=Aspergillus fumigatiaffinis TaxID=340414 RepID=A0A8H4ECE0_9EURO|nr:hypothetical protein CNMCM6457_004045 [Aspergillus fumigatiaffinis]KAF4226602.1 hypothetical protein CNMCM6805_004360 [Aspergillus fumigatiaffinis]
MDLDHDHQIWQSGCHEPLQLHTPLKQSLKSPTLDSPSFSSTAFDAATPRPGYPGALSLHHYRRFLSQDDGFIALNRDGGKTLRRKNAALDLNKSQTSLTPPLCSFSVSSAASSPPPLSPSYTPSPVSYRGENGPGLDESLFSFPSSFLDINTSQQTLRPSPVHSPHQLLETFRARLARFPEPESQEQTFTPRHTKARSDSMLLELRRPIATVEHQGTSFEILNPHESLKFARIVSYIEDVDSSSITDDPRDSFNATRLQSETLIFEHDETIEAIHDHNQAHDRYISDADEEKAHYELIGDIPYQPMPSISERLEGNETDMPQSHKWSSPPQSRPMTAQSYGSELGEPGYSVLASYDGAEWTGTTDDILAMKYDEMQRSESTRRSSSDRKKRGTRNPFRKLRTFARSLRRGRPFRR